MEPRHLANLSRRCHTAAIPRAFARAMTQTETPRKAFWRFRYVDPKRRWGRAVLSETPQTPDG